MQGSASTTGAMMVATAKARQLRPKVDAITIACVCLAIGLPSCTAVIPQRYQLAAEPLMPAEAASSQSIQLIYAVAAGDTTASIASTIATQIGRDAGFAAAGVTASAPAGSVVTVNLPQSFKLNVTVAPSGTGHTTAVINEGPPATLTIGGTPTAGDNITITAIDLSALDAVHRLVQDSQTKCAAFVNSMFAQAAGSGLILDVLTTAASAAATVFTPINTVHVLTAISTVLSGVKTSISSEYLNSLAISHVTQAIQSTYTADMQKYITYLNGADPSKINVFAERSTILSYHNECGLAAAEGSIGSALQPAAPQQAAPQVLTVSYTVGAGDTTASIASSIAKKVSGDSGFSAAGVSASAPAGSSVITFKLPQSFKVNSAVAPSGAGHTTAVINEGPPATLTIGAPTQGDTITITGTAGSSTSSTASTPSPAKAAAPKPPAAVLGMAPAEK